MSEGELASTTSDNLVKRDEHGRLLPGQKSLNPLGRPKDKTLKEFAREYFMLKSDDEKRKYIDDLERKRPGFVWEMGEGRPQADITSAGEKIYPTPIYASQSTDSSKETV